MPNSQAFNEGVNSALRLERRVNNYPLNDKAREEWFEGYDSVSETISKALDNVKEL